MPTATARAHPNIAFVKYWGNRDDSIRLPANGSISMNLRALETVTTVSLDSAAAVDILVVNGEQQTGAPLERASRHLNYLRGLASVDENAVVTSTNNFPTGTGIASSASAFAALTVATANVLDLDLSESELSAVARLGSGSACRSIPGGFVEWYAGEDHSTSYAESIAAPDYWNLVDLVAVVSEEHKAVGSTGGHSLARTSPLQVARVIDTEQRLNECRRAILERDFERFSAVVEHDTLMMHAVMMTSRPALLYWLPTTVAIMQAVRGWRAAGIPACFTVDAGPNVHVITDSHHTSQLSNRLLSLEGVKNVFEATPGGPTALVADDVQ